MNLFGYYNLGLRAMTAAQVGLQVAGDNISNVNTPGYARRRVDLSPGTPIQVPGGWLDNGVDVRSIRRIEDGFLQASLEREQGSLGESGERMRGLKEIESFFGRLDGPGIASDLANMQSAFRGLAGQADSAPLRRGAVSAADRLASSIRSVATKLDAQRRTENDAVHGAVQRVNALASQLASLNDQIHAAEAGGANAAPLRDQRSQIVEELVQWTGGSAVPAENGRVGFALPGGPTLVTAEQGLSTGLSLTTRPDASGMLQIASGSDGSDITGKIQSGKLGALLALRDVAIPGQLSRLDAMAADLAGRTNALLAGAKDLNGNPGQALFVGASSGGPITASNIAVSSAIAADPRLLAVSATGAAGDGAIALQLGALLDAPSAALGGASLSGYLADGLATLVNEAARADVAHGVATDLVASLASRRDQVSGVSLDEEAVDLIRFQSAYQAGARFLKVLNDITQIAVSLTG